MYYELGRFVALLLKNNPNILEILDLFINLGSSKAYLIRENSIVYKNKEINQKNQNQPMKTQLTKYTIDNMLEDTGDDYIILHVFFKTKDRAETTRPYYLPYDTLHLYIKNIDEPAYNYLTKIRSNIHGYGPKHSKVFKVIEAENFDLEPYMQSYLEALTDLEIEQHYEWSDRLCNPEIVEKAAAALENIKQVVDDDYKNDNIKSSEFMDELDQTLHELTFKYFPDLFEKGEQHIKEYRSILSRATLSYYEDIDNLRYKK